MPPTDRSRLPAGLPSLVSGSEGFDALCELLSIVSTKQKQAIAGTSMVKQFVKTSGQPAPHKSRTAGRLRHHLLSFYGDPDARRRVWRHHFDGGFSSGDPEHPLIPSLEASALSAYDTELLGSLPDAEELGDCTSLYSPDLSGDAWLGPALAALPRLRHDFSEWQSLPDGRKGDVLMAAFATTTLLDDARLLEWAVTLSDEIARGYPFMAPPKETGDREGGQVAVEIATDSTEEDALGQLQGAATQLGAAANALAEGPISVELFESVAVLAESVLHLREPALEEAARKTSGALLADFAGVLGEKAEAAPWLGMQIDEIMDAWRSSYANEKGTGNGGLEADLGRARSELDDLLPKWSTALAAADDARAALENHESAMEATSVRDLQLQAARSAQVSSTLQTALDAMNEVLLALAPNPSRGSFSPRGPAEQPGSADESTQEPSVDDALPPADTVPAAVGDASREPDHTAAHRDGSASTDAGEPRVDTLPRPETPTSDRSVEPDEPAGKQERPGNRSSGAEGRDSDGAASKIPSGVVEEAVWNAVGRGRLGLAYQIARLDQTMEEREVVPWPEVLAAVALGMAMGRPDDALAQAFGQQSGDVLSRVDLTDAIEPTRDALNLLLFSAGLRPALFASQQGVGAALLRHVELSKALTPVYRFASVMADHAERLQGVHLDVGTLNGVLDEGVWKDRIARHAEEVARWRSSAAAATFLFAPAGAVWQRWINASGILADLTRLLSTDDRRHVPRVREIADLLEDRRSVHDLIERTYRQDLGRRGGSISGRALAQFEGRLATPLDLARTWLRIIEARPGGTGFVERTVERLHRDVDTHAPVARETMERLRDAGSSEALTSALTCALTALESVHRIFRRERSGDGLPVGPVEALSEDLLFVPGLRVDQRGDLDPSTPRADALARMIDAESHAKTLSEAFETRLAEGHLYEAHAICGRMAAEDDPGEDACRERLTRAVIEARPELQRRLNELTDKLEQAFIIGEVSDDERADLNGAILEATRRLGREDEALTVASDVEAIEVRVEPSLAKGVEKIRAQLNAYLPLDDPREQAFVQDALDAADLTTLHEQLDCLRTGQPLLSADADGRSRLLSFLAAADRIAEALDGEAGPSQDTLVRAVESRKDVLGLEFSSLSPPQAQRSAELLRHWYLLARSRTIDPKLTSEFFASLGFTLVGDGVEARGDNVATLRAEALRTRDLCPTYSFGSEANGHYDVVFNWNSPLEPIVQAVNANPHRRVLVLHFGRLARADREWLRGWSVQHSVQFVTIDETLVLFLASVSGGALRALFDCALPFTCAEPFFTAPGLVPPESFFGRESERRSITEPYGSCFVYGGRQLGKTALLNAVQTTFHDPAAGHLAQCIDLKVHDVGIAHGAEHIWQVLWRVFAQLGVVDDDQPMPPGRDRLVEEIAKSVTGWLADSENRRILLLLDEADAFLVADLENDFPVSTRLKGLMDETQRRFKVVLCGLHNVLRNTERANHPLAHFGEPICVGPLLDNGDLQHARALLREPLAAVGYAFESESLLTQILVWTNYYPSLIQLYGEALLRYLRQAVGRGFPYAVTADDVQAVFARDQFRDFIRERFALTLQLDPRYEVIAYAMAFDLLQGESEGLSGGLRGSRVLELARDVWPDGFDFPEQEFGTLLEEMCGLGVLRRRPSEAGRPSYAFRNPNVLLLLGDTENILGVLLKERELPKVFEASAFHAPYLEGGLQSPRRGPLTYEQEALLKRGGRVAVVCGTRAANLSTVPEFLQQQMEQGRLRRLDQCADAGGLGRRLGMLRPGRGTYVHLVDDRDAWTYRWLERAANALKETQRGGSLRVVFTADADLLWNLVAELPDALLESSNDLFDWVPAQPWNGAFLSRWCSDQNLNEASAKILELQEATGGWPLLLERYARSNEKSWKAKSLELDEYVSDHRDELLDALGVGSPAARLQMAALRDCGSLTPEDAEVYAALLREDGNHAFEPGVLRRRLYWAVQLGLVQEVGGTWSLNSLLARLLPTDA